MSATKIGENTTTVTIFHEKCTLWHITLTIYIHKNKFTSHKKYSFGLSFSGIPKKSRTDQVYIKFFTLFEKKRLTNLQK